MVEKELFEKYYKRIKRIMDIANSSEYYHELFEKAEIDLSQKVSYQDFARIGKTDKNSYEKNRFRMITKHLKGLHERGQMKR